MEEGKNPPSTFPAIRSHFEAGEKTEALVKFPAQSHRLTKKKTVLKEARAGGKDLTFTGTKIRIISYYSQKPGKQGILNS